MTARPAPSGSSRNTLSLALIVLGGILLVLVPLLLVGLAFAGAKDVHIPGTLIIISVVSGMSLVALGAAVRA